MPPYPTPRSALAQALKEALADFPSPSHTLEQGGHQAGEAAEFVVAEVTDTITKVSGGAGRRHLWWQRSRTPSQK